MSVSGDTGILQQFNINELAGATGLILGALGGILAIIFKSRCYCRLNLCYLCFCERKPPPDKLGGDSSDDDDKADKILKTEKTILKKEDKILKGEKKIERDIESLIPPNKSPKIEIKIEEDIRKDEDSKLEDLT